MSNNLSLYLALWVSAVGIATAQDFTELSQTESGQSVAAVPADAPARSGPRPTVDVKSAITDESSGFRRASVKARAQFFPLPDTRIRIEPAWERLSDPIDHLIRPSVGVALRQGFDGSHYLGGSYRRYFPDDVRGTNEWEAGGGFRWSATIPEIRAGFRRRSLVDTPIGYEDVAALNSIGSGGTTIAGVRNRLQIDERYLGLVALPVAGSYVYAEWSRGRISDANHRSAIAAGFGINVASQLGLPPGHSLTPKYDFYRTESEFTSPSYFSPQDFRIHSIGLDWRYAIADVLTLGIEGSRSKREGGAMGYTAGAFIAWTIARQTVLEGRFRVIDDTAFHVKSFIVGPRVTF